MKDPFMADIKTFSQVMEAHMPKEYLMKPTDGSEIHTLNWIWMTIH